MLFKSRLVSPEGFQGQYTGLGTQLCIQLMKSSSEKLSLIHILRDKIFIAIVSKHFKKLNSVIDMSVFLRKRLKLFSCYVSTSLYFRFRTRSCVQFYIVIGYDVPLA